MECCEREVSFISVDKILMKYINFPYLFIFCHYIAYMKWNAFFRKKALISRERFFFFTKSAKTVQLHKPIGSVLLY